MSSKSSRSWAAAEAGGDGPDAEDGRSVPGTSASLGYATVPPEVSGRWAPQNASRKVLLILTVPLGLMTAAAILSILPTLTNRLTSLYHMHRLHGLVARWPDGATVAYCPSWADPNGQPRVTRHPVLKDVEEVTDRMIPPPAAEGRYLLYLGSRRRRPGDETLLTKVWFEPAAVTFWTTAAGPTLLAGTYAPPHARDDGGWHMTLTHQPRGFASPLTKDVTFYAGQSDATDPTHFTIRYARDGREGLIDGWVRPDSSVLLERRESPHDPARLVGTAGGIDPGSP